MGKSGPASPKVRNGASISGRRGWFQETSHSSPIAKNATLVTVKLSPPNPRRAAFFSDIVEYPVDSFWRQGGDKNGGKADGQRPVVGRSEPDEPRARGRG